MKKQLICWNRGFKLLWKKFYLSKITIQLSTQSMQLQINTFLNQKLIIKDYNHLIRMKSYLKRCYLFREQQMTCRFHCQREKLRSLDLISVQGMNERGIMMVCHLRIPLKDLLIDRGAVISHQLWQIIIIKAIQVWTRIAIM